MACREIGFGKGRENDMGQTIYQAICQQADAMREQLRSVRRDLHTYAEPGWCEIRTSSIIAKRLTELGYQVLTGPDVCLAEARMGLPPEAQLEAVNGIKEDLGRVSDVVQSNAAASQECSAMVRELSEQAHMLDQLSKT